MKRLLAVVVIMLAVTAVSSAQLAFRGIGGAIGFASCSPGLSTESFSGFVLAAHADLGEVAKDISIFPDITYWGGSKDVGGYSLKLSDLAINVNGHYNIAMEGMLKPYVGAGLGLNFFSFSVPTVTNFFTGATSTESVSYTRLGINLLAGINYKLSDMLVLVVEPRYVLASDFNTFQIKAGVTYALK
jgi:hypothetical protein